LTISVATPKWKTRSEMGGSILYTDRFALLCLHDIILLHFMLNYAIIYLEHELLIRIANGFGCKRIR